ncbi:MAG: ABC transporter permease [Candidatus Tectimicrobiota bacterium]|nr:MAG: ABC transporter permease [Candidatus Tectomicrobia bacterium]
MSAPSLPFPSKRRPLSSLLAVLFLGAVVLSARVAEVRPQALLAPEALEHLWAFVRGMVPPAHSPAFLRSLLTPLRETVQMALLGTLLAAALGLPLAVLAASTVLFAGPLHEAARGGPLRWLARRLPYLLSRLLLNVLRAIPELVWALLFVRVLGLGPAPGVLALGISYGGMIGKVYADLLEGVDPGPLLALQSTGASRLQLVLYGWLPQALPNMLAYTLYRWECALRASALMGFVGAGGIGQHIELAMRMFAYDEVASLILVVFCLSAAVERLGDALRRRLL